MSKKFDVAVVGATGAVGEAMLELLHERAFPYGKVYALGGEGAAGGKAPFGNRELLVEDITSFDFSRVQIALFSAGAAVSAAYAPKAAAAGCVVIDNSSQFRHKDDIPLVIPEVNPQEIARYKEHGIIASPNCLVIQLLVALKPLHDAAKIERINVCTMQAVSGAGREAIEELAQQTRALLNFQEVPRAVFPRQIAFNVLPQVDAFEDNGYTREEMKVIRETRKILGDESIQVNATCVQVPVFYGHSEAVQLETRRKLGAEEARDLLVTAPGVELMEEGADGGYPTAVTEASGQDAVFVGRVREDLSHPRGLNLWVVSDNIRKGAALNSLQIAEVLVRDYL